MLMKVFVAIEVLSCFLYATGLNPILFVPGNGGSLLKTRYIESPPHSYCGLKNKWFTLWLNPYLMLPATLDCFVQTIKLEYDNNTKSTTSPSFCEVKPVPFGDISAIEYFSSVQTGPTAQFHFLVEKLVKQYGYRRNVDIRGAAYDFRKGPNELDEFQSDLQSLIEKMYFENGNSSVILVGHSMGSLQLLRLLNKVSQEWKDTFIKSLISISAPYIGAVQSIRVILSGFNEMIPFINQVKLRDAESTWPSLYYLMPFEDFWSNESIVVNDKATFTAKDLEKLLRQSNIQYAVNHYQDVKQFQKQSAPNVTVYCIYSPDVSTISFLDYRHVKFPDEQPSFSYGPGDGTVNLESLEICSQWKNQQAKEVFTHTISQVSHLSILSDGRLWQYINKAVLNQSWKTRCDKHVIGSLAVLLILNFFSH